MSERLHRTAAKARVERLVQRQGLAVPREHRSSKPLVTWRATGCGCWLLRVYLTPDGWVLDGRDFQIPMPQWIERINPGGARHLDDGTPVTLESYRAGQWKAFDAGKISGVSSVLDLDIDTWAPGEFEVGCEHGATMRPLSDLADDCRKVRTTRRAAPDRRVAVAAV